MVGSGVNVGSAVAKGKVAKGVNVGKSKLNNGVGVASVPDVGKIFGLGTAVEGARRENTNDRQRDQPGDAHYAVRYRAGERLSTPSLRQSL